MPKVVVDYIRCRLPQTFRLPQVFTSAVLLFDILLFYGSNFYTSSAST